MLWILRRAMTFCENRFHPRIESEGKLFVIML
jgi:hypothetical protein